MRHHPSCLARRQSLQSPRLTSTDARRQWVAPPQAAIQEVPMFRALSSVATLFLFWVALSGFFTPFLLERGTRVGDRGRVACAPDGRGRQRGASDPSGPAATVVLALAGEGDREVGVGCDQDHPATRGCRSSRRWCASGRPSGRRLAWRRMPTRSRSRRERSRWRWDATNFSSMH